MRLLPAGFVLAFVVCGIGAASIANASETAKPTTVTATTPAEFDAQVAQIRNEIKPGGRYGGIKPGDRETVESSLDRMSALLHSKGSVEALDGNEKTELFNAQEHANAILANNEQNRLICTNVIKSGTHFPQKVCQTVAERDAIRRDSTDTFQQTLGHKINNWDGK
jgi:hypothetical protein